jgi:hypothetical protein
MMQQIPLQAVPDQVLSVALGGQSTQLKIYQRFYGLFIDVYINNTLIIGGVICENLNRIVRDAYLGFLGDLVFLDTQSPVSGVASDPDYTGLGDRYQLIYLEMSDLQ